MTSENVSILRKATDNARERTVLTEVPRELAREALVALLASEIEDMYQSYKPTTAEDARFAVSDIYAVLDEQGDVVETIDANQFWGTPELHDARHYEFFAGKGAACVWSTARERSDEELSGIPF